MSAVAGAAARGLRTPFTGVRASATFPAIRLASHCGGLPVDVTLVAQFAPGQGDVVIGDALRRQQAHPAFVDALDEPSTRIGTMDLARGDPSSLYTFGVGAGGHPFHRHAGNRVFTAVSGSAGAHLRFSTASQGQIDADPQAFLDALHVVEVPPDCLFSVRFGGGTWHQFVSARPDGPHPTLFALSCHPDEAGGGLDPATRARVIANTADIPSLTEVLPPALQRLLETRLRAPATIATTALSLHAPPASIAARLCTGLRGAMGRMRAAVAARRPAAGFLADNGGGRTLVTRAPSEDFLLARHWPGACDHEDQVAVRLGVNAGPAEVMDRLLEGFVENPPDGVSRLMALRNALVRPARLRTSPLGCPASSLLAVDAPLRFAGRHPVLAQHTTGDGRRIEVILGADDRHLAFRTCVTVETLPTGGIVCAMTTRVRIRNAFGRFYLAAIRRVHRRYVAPAMLRHAVDHAARALRAGEEGVPSRHAPGVVGAARRTRRV
ncbi:DUF2867 domain-containing protein [Luteimonas deserti]|uniref:DUF2867 domain-containing protein n=1 Tax=Luteimonas deserti TaxID=2752306 RepID=A0A7Z0QQW0_9GAMM|nr:DUF2867 domain-containing protein [Luteimonas deserti]NYZ63129.1 DUF2867 domain-containing protein [Luteimonas deserti]